MSHQSLDPQGFADRLDRAFGEEPPQAPVADDLGRGKRRLRRRRVGTSLAGLAVVGVVGAAASLVPGVPGTGPGPAPAPATGAVLSPAEIVATCMRKENVGHYGSGGAVSESAALQLMGTPTLMTSARIDNRTEATLRSEDGSYWGECQFRNAPDNGVKNTMSVYPTDVSFLPRYFVGGVTAYEPPAVDDPRLEGTATVSVPDFETPCVTVTESRAERAAAQARCPEFTMHWNDRRPAEVAAVRVTTPDGIDTWADVRRGYLSFAYTGRMTPQIAAQVRSGTEPGAQRIVFYDKDGNVLVDDRDPGHVAAEEGGPTILNFPSLAWWLR